MAFPDGYLAREKPSIFFDGHRDRFMNRFLYDLVIEDVVEFVIVRNWVRDAKSNRPVGGTEKLKLTRSENPAECARMTPASRAVWSLGIFRSKFDILRKRCVIVRPVDQNHADLELREHSGYWSFRIASSGKLIARAPRAPRHQKARALFPDQVNVSQKKNSPVYKDDFTERELISAIELGGYARRAALSILSLRVRLEDDKLTPETLVRKKVTRNIVEALLALFPPAPNSGWGIAPGFSALIPGASTETAALIYPKLVDMLYAPIKTSKPHGPWYYGNWWKLQIREKRPELEETYVRNKLVPAIAVAGMLRSASALVLSLGEPYIQRFYEEFKTDIRNRTSRNARPSFHTVILARAEPDLLNVITEIRNSKLTPVRFGTLWALIEHGKNLPTEFIQELRSGCLQDPQFLNDPVASRKYLDGNSFCSHRFGIKDSGQTQNNG